MFCPLSIVTRNIDAYYCINLAPYKVRKKGANLISMLLLTLVLVDVDCGRPVSFIEYATICKELYPSFVSSIFNLRPILVILSPPGFQCPCPEPGPAVPVPVPGAGSRHVPAGLRGGQHGGGRAGVEAQEAQPVSRERLPKYSSM